VRHAIAGERDPERWPDDRERPLTARGVRRFRTAARGVGRLVPSVDRVLSSSWTRAWDTAKILERRTGWPAPERLTALEGGLPDAVVAALAAYSDADTLALVGHEPYLGELASFLLTGEPHRVRFDLNKGGAIALTFAGEIEAGQAHLRWLLQPKALRRLASSGKR
jgi:phosphohistidine phosphatase